MVHISSDIISSVSRPSSANTSIIFFWRFAPDIVHFRSDVLFWIWADSSLLLWIFILVRILESGLWAILILFWLFHILLFPFGDHFVRSGFLTECSSQASSSLAPRSLEWVTRSLHLTIWLYLASATQITPVLISILEKCCHIYFSTQFLETKVYQNFVRNPRFWFLRHLWNRSNLQKMA